MKNILTSQILEELTKDYQKPKSWNNIKKILSYKNIRKDTEWKDLSIFIYASYRLGNCIIQVRKAEIKLWENFNKSLRLLSRKGSNNDPSLIVTINNSLKKIISLKIAIYSGLNIISLNKNIYLKEIPDNYFRKAGSWRLTPQNVLKNFAVSRNELVKSKTILKFPSIKESVKELMKDDYYKEQQKKFLKDNVTTINEKTNVLYKRVMKIAQSKYDKKFFFSFLKKSDEGFKEMFTANWLLFEKIRLNSRKN